MAKIVSEGTLRDDDLFESFVSYLEVNGNSQTKEVLDFLRAEWKNANDEERSFILNEDVFELMAENAAEGTFFSSSDGDGARFGYWPIESRMMTRCGRCEMNFVIEITMLIASFLHTNFAWEWACWEDMTVQPQAEYRYFCEYSGEENGGTYAAVWSDGNAVKTYIEYNQ